MGRRWRRGIEGHGDRWWRYPCRPLLQPPGDREHSMQHQHGGRGDPRELEGTGPSAAPGAPPASFGPCSKANAVRSAHPQARCRPPPAPQQWMQLRDCGLSPLPRAPSAPLTHLGARRLGLLQHLVLVCLAAQVAHGGGVGSGWVEGSSRRGALGRGLVALRERERDRRESAVAVYFLFSFARARSWPALDWPT